MNSDKINFPTRKSTHLKNFDYSRSGAYFITVCARERQDILSQIVKQSSAVTVGEGLAPPVSVQMKPCGEIAKKQLLALETRFPNIVITDYVIMPDHIHAIILLREAAGGASPSPTLNDIICAYKSLMARACKQLCGVEKIFQRSYFEHIIHDKEDYKLKRNYIYENPMRRFYSTTANKE